jgi:hypothetical protein
MHPRRGCWLANTHYLEGLDTVCIYCCELLNGRWQHRVGNGSGFRSLEKPPRSSRFLLQKPRQGVLLAGASVRLLRRAGYASRILLRHFCTNQYWHENVSLWAIATADACTSATVRPLCGHIRRGHSFSVEVAGRASLERAGGMQHRWGRDRDGSNLHLYIKRQESMVGLSHASSSRDR